MDKAKILVVEDEGIIAQDIESTLKAMGYGVAGVVVSGEEAIRKAVETQPDLVLMDIMLRGEMDGVEAADQIRARLDIPVVFLTAYADERTLQRAKITGAFGYLIKPFEERGLRSTIEVALYQHEMEARLKKLADEWEATFDSIQDWISIHDRDFRILRVNKSLAQAYHLSPEELRGKHCYEIFHDAQEPIAQCPHRRTSESGEVSREEIFEPSLAKHLEVCTSPLRDERGGIAGTVHIVKDISPRKRAEEAAQWLAQENAGMAGIGRVISSTLNIEEVYERFAAEVRKLIPFDRIVVSLNNPEEGTATMTYASGMELEGRRIDDVFPLPHSVNEEIMRTRAGLLVQPEAVEELEDRFPVLIAGFQAGLRSMMSVPLISRDQVIGALHLRSKKTKAYTDRDLRLAERIGAQIAGAIANSQLFLERTRAEEELRHSEEHFRLLIESSSDIITQIDHQQNICYTTPSVERVLGYKPEDYIGQNIFQFIHPDDLKSTMAAFIQGLQKVGGTISIEHRVKHKNGSWPFFQTISRSILDESGNRLIVANSRDITERKNLESQLLQAQKLESIGQLAAGIAHEINTPTQYVGDNTRFFEDAFKDLNRLLGKYDQLFQTIKNGAPLDGALQEIEGIVKEIDLAYLTDEIPKAIRQTLEGVERVRTIVQAMKEFSHPGTKEKTPINLNKAIQNTITVARNEWKYVAEMATDFDSSLPVVSGLPGELNQVILNMITNAAHAIADVVGDGSKGKGTITVSTRQDGNWAEIRVSDTGTGIPENIRSRVFDPFFTTKKVGKGTGQGLTISHSVIVDKHGGTIHFDTEMGKGSTFIIRLPMEDGVGL